MAAATIDTDSASNVYPFVEVNRRLWHLPTAANGEVDWGAVRACLAESPEEATSVVGRYFLSWLSPYVTLASRERLEEAYMPPPQRPHRAVYCGALLSGAFRDVEVRSGRDAWRTRVEAAVRCEDGAVRVLRANALAAVRFRGEDGVRGRLRWTGYVRSSDAPHVLLGGVEWDGDGVVPRYRQRYAGEAAAVTHDGAVHGERLFYQAWRGQPRCTCEYLSDLVPLSADGGGGAVPVRCHTPRAPSLLTALFRTFRSDLLAMLGPSFVAMMCEVATPWLLQQFVLFLQSNKAEKGVTKGAIMFFVFAVVTLAKPLSFNKQMHRGRRISSLFRAATLGVVFEKCFTVSPDALSHPEMSAGRILTMASSDMENIKEFPMQVMFLWMAPVMLTLYLIYLYTLVGWSVLAGVVVFLLSIPLQGVITQVLEHRQDSLSSCTDQRLRRTNELLSGIRIVKTMGWESKFLDAIEDGARADELKYRRTLQICQVGLWTIVFGTPPFMIAAVLTVYTLAGHALDASIVLPVIAVISAVTFPIMMLPEAFTSLAKFIVSTGRITQFLECDDSHIILEDAEKVFGACSAAQPGAGDPAGDPAGACFVGATMMASVPTALPAYEPRHHGLRRLVDCVCCAVLRRHVPVELQWTRTAEAAPTQAAAAATAPPATTPASAAEGVGDTLYTLEDKALLRDVSVCLPRGQLTVVVGATGSGKSVLLATLLGAFRFRGRVGVCPSIAYVPQQPWIMQETIRANITFFEGDQRGARGASAVGGGVAFSPLRGACAQAARAGSTDAGNERLSAAVRCCQLEADLALLSGGLSTEIGEKGINLSGGQKARVSLARAVYADRDVYVLDDPLSALDAHVGRHVMEEVVLRALAGKTRVLVTHQLHVLPYADQVVVVRDGCVVFAGTHDAYTESEWKAYVESEEDAATAQRRGPMTEGAVEEVNDFSPAESPVVDVAQRMPSAAPAPCEKKTHTAASLKGSVGEGSESEPDDFREREEEPYEARQLRERRGSHVADLSSDDDEEKSSKAPSSQRARGRRSGAQVVVADDAGEENLITAEEKESGHIPWSIYRRYFVAGGGVSLAARLLLCSLFGEIVATGSSVWLTLWSVQYFAGVLTTNQQLLIYLAFTVAVQIIIPTNDLFFFHFARRASRRLHATLLYTVSSSTLTFFDRTPLGRVINRFSKDIYTLDDELPANVVPLVGISGYVTTSLIVTMYTSPPTIAVVAIAGYVFFRLLRFYTTVVREVRRRGSVVQSPLFSLLEEVVQGRTTIAAYGKSHALFAEALRRLDLVYSCTYIEKAVTLWLSIRVEYIAAVMIIVVGVIGVVEKIVDTSPVMPEARVGLISLSLTMCLDLSWSLSALIDLAAVVEASMNSVQRVCHYIDHVPQEPLLLAPSDGHVAAALARRAGDGGAAAAAAVPPAARARDVVVVNSADGHGNGDCSDSAETGSLVLEHVDMRYRPGLPLVLRDVSFAVLPGQKVGVVGRTGSGKSTLLLALLRLVEVCGGCMRVCGRDAQSYTLPALRRLFSMIPQDPVLFDGTVRSNVDPFGDATDAEVRRALASVGFVSGGEGGGGAEEVPALDTVVQEGGSNFSVGQRQLLCLARALLKKGSAFILMDEATANVDARLDQTVQRVVAEQFRDYTVVTIAHRLHTVASYDVILVMAHGRVVEFGSPRTLLEDRGSAFYGMVAQSSAVLSAATGGAAGGGGGNHREGDAAVGGLSDEERQRRVEEAVASFLKACK
ncbi:putative mitochondrial p-glycoprotein-like protein [Leptomonas pyrrhocoris]|uniref:Putative mitochondrial p-glycoprotein-like protein n=1 Tax=Leptomonas pyrrhocoris TaxID=157538 RepID=A0A0M9FZ53_LEPPY|nr:putative mitochondrial p-glycoprotein-like protein [Leptomonas pyrrhocoris]KPA78899.1 putative mitochondrial p-glycoprotein-like protein [Leptomonas pyrrhocoris]|eukprot:XP_015657338.1 putative mitochondrial p-glycoprotein-like protein [Leptomonas pyrrhocoris]